MEPSLLQPLLQELRSLGGTSECTVLVGNISEGTSQFTYADRLCGLVVRVPGCRSRGPGFDSRRYQIF
jgi:hypothetical protein